MKDSLRSVNYREFGAWDQGWCLLITGGMMSEVVVIVERKDGTITEIPIKDVQFNDRVFDTAT